MPTVYATTCLLIAFIAGVVTVIVGVAVTPSCIEFPVSVYGTCIICPDGTVNFTSPLFVDVMTNPIFYSGRDCVDVAPSTVGPAAPRPCADSTVGGQSASHTVLLEQGCSRHTMRDVTLAGPCLTKKCRQYDIGCNVTSYGMVFMLITMILCAICAAQRRPSS